MKALRFRFVIPLVLLAFVVVAFRLWSGREPTFRTPTEAQLQKFYSADTRKVFENATTWTLYSIEPHPSVDEKNTFHDYPIVGQMTVKDTGTRARLQKALDGAVANSGDVASCFNPHHGLRATLGNKTVDLVVCFGCGTSYFYIGNERYDASVAINSRDSNEVWNRVTRRRCRFAAQGAWITALWLNTQMSFYRTKKSRAARRKE